MTETKKEKSKLRKIINWTLNILLVVFFIIVVYMVLYRIFGSSPTDLQLILWIAGFLITAILKLFNLTYSINREIGELRTGIRSGFNLVKQDIQEIKNLIIK